MKIPKELKEYLKKHRLVRKARKYAEAEYGDLYKNKAFDGLNDLFVWEDTKEGIKFWQKHDGSSIILVSDNPEYVEL